MNNLKKSIMGKYNAADVDELLSKVRNDYELCLKQQKERITFLRDENRRMTKALQRFKENERYIIGAITKAEETAESIIAGANQKASENLVRMRNEERQILMAVDGCYERLRKLGKASESIFMAVSKALGDNGTQKDDKNQRVRAVKSIFTAT